MSPLIDQSPHPALVRELLEVIRFLHAQGWTPATSSNFSYRDPAAPEAFHISVSGRDKGALKEDEFLAVDFQGRMLSPQPGVRPSAETLLHALVYTHQPSAAVVLHTHSVNGTVLSKLYELEGGLWFRDFEILKGLEGITTHQAEVFLPVFPNSQDMPQLAADIDAYWKNGARSLYGFLLAGHGLYTWGETPAQARRHAEVFEFLFECILKLRQVESSWRR